MGFAHFIAGRDTEAAEWAARALRIKPDWPPALRVALVAAAMHGHAAEAARIRTRYAGIDPQISVRKICSCYALRRDVDRRLVTGLRKAGLAE